MNIAKDDRYIRLCGRLEDKFGDNGIVSIIIGEKKQNALHIDLWLMSCRVLKRNMEFAMFASLIEQCKQQGIKTIIGYYYPTAKNHMVKDLFQTLGFDQEKSENIWRYDVELAKAPVHIITIDV